MRNLLFVSLAAASLALSLSEKVFAGIGGGDFGPGNGGDSIALEFTAIGRALSLNWDHFASAPFPLSKTQFDQTLNQTRVTSVEQTLLPGREVDAINYPEASLIQVSRTRWSALGDLPKKASLVLHEYLVISGVTDDHYEVSGPALKKLSAILESPELYATNSVCAIQMMDLNVAPNPIVLDVMDTLIRPAHRIGRARYLRRLDDTANPVNSLVIDFSLQPPFTSADGKTHLFYAIYSDSSHHLNFSNVVRVWTEIDFSKGPKTTVSLLPDLKLFMNCFEVAAQR